MVLFSWIILTMVIELLSAMFVDRTKDLLQLAVSRETNGVAVTDVDNDGQFEIFIAGYTGPNLVLKVVNGTFENIAEIGSPFEILRDISGAARGVCACDMNGDGREEIYVVNSNHRYSGPDTYTDRLFIWRNGQYEDLYQDKVNKNMPMFPGSSVACIDRDGDGRYGFLVTTYSEFGLGSFRLIEIDNRNSEDESKGRIKLIDIATQIGLKSVNGGQGIAVGPIVGNDSQSDIFVTNEASTRQGNSGNNNLFQWLHSKSFKDIANTEMSDRNQDGRGVTISDINKDGLMDIIYGNWFGPHRILIQHRNQSQHVRFQNVASAEFARSSPVTSVLCEDWNNDGNLEVLLTNQYHIPGYIDKHQLLSSNRLFTTNPKDEQLYLQSIDIGDAIETTQTASGAAVGDLDEDGYLELYISHQGPSFNQSVKIYHVMERKENNWLRILPLTQHGGPARGAKVTLTLSDLSELTKIIDSGSGFMSQMEPVAHFGLSKYYVKFIQVTWPSGRRIRRSLKETEVNVSFIITYEGSMTTKSKYHQIYSKLTFQPNNGKRQVPRYCISILIFLILLYCI